MFLLNNIKRATVLFLLMVAGISIAHAQSNDEDAVKYAITESFEAILTRFEKDKVLDFYTEDFLLLEHGLVWNNDTINMYLDKALAQDPLPERKNEFDFIKVEVDGNRAWVAYHNRAVISVDGEVVRDISWLESADLIKTEKGWRIQLLHSTIKPSRE